MVEFWIRSRCSLCPPSPTHPYYWKLILKSFQIFLQCWSLLHSGKFFDIFSRRWFCQQDWGQAFGMEIGGPFRLESNWVALCKVLHWLPCLAGTLNTQHIIFRAGSIPSRVPQSEKPSPWLQYADHRRVNVDWVKHLVLLTLCPDLHTAVRGTNIVLNPVGVQQKSSWQQSWVNVHVGLLGTTNWQFCAFATGGAVWATWTALGPSGVEQFLFSHQIAERCDWSPQLHAFYGHKLWLAGKPEPLVEQCEFSGSSIPCLCGVSMWRETQGVHAKTAHVTQALWPPTTVQKPSH